jgi:hypothetical protein
MRGPAIAMVLLAACADVPPLCLTDGFDQGAIDARRWKVTAVSGAAAGERDGRLELSVAAAVDNHVKVESYRTFAFDGRAVEVDVARYVRSADTSQVLLAVESDDLNQFLVKATHGQLYFQITVNGALVTGATALTTVGAIEAIDGWRIAHDAAGNTVRLDTRAAGVWTSQPPVTRPPELVQPMKIQLEADAAAGAASAPDVAAFANLRVVEPACTQGAEYDEHLGPYGPP